MSAAAKRSALKVGSLKIRFVKSYEEITNNNDKLLSILNVLKDFKKIPDLDKVSAIRRIEGVVAGLTELEQKHLVKYALAYPLMHFQMLKIC